MTNTSAPAQPSQPQQASSSQFKRAKNVKIRGGRFTTELAPRLTIKVTRMFVQFEIRLKFIL